MLRNAILVTALLGLGTAALTEASGAVRAPNMQGMIAEETAKCATGADSMACIKVRAMRFLDTVLTQDTFKLADVEVHSNGYQTPAVADRRGRSHDSDAQTDFLDQVEQYIQAHDLTVNLPVADAKVTVSSRNLANDELSLSVKFADETDGVVEGKGKKGNLFKKGKKKRLRKMVMPIMVLILLKALTVIPMAIGILKIKAMNALGLGFLAFIVSVGLAIFQLCKKLAAEHHHHSAHITAHGPWDGRALNAAAASAAVGVVNIPLSGQYTSSDSAQSIAYSGYQQA